MGELTRIFAPLAREIAFELLGQPDNATQAELRWGRKQGLVVNVAGPRAGTYHDFTTGDHGDLVDLAMREKGWSNTDALAWLRTQVGGCIVPSGFRPVPAVMHPVTEKKTWSHTAQAVWGRTIPLRGSLGEDYLRKRQCFIEDANDLRFLPPSRLHSPSIVGRVTDFQSGKPMTLHFLRLDPASGWKSGPGVNLKGHKVDGGVVRLTSCVEVGGALGVAEGIETALSVSAAGRGPAWAALSAGNMSKLPPIAAIGALIIWADNDLAGRAAANTLARRWYYTGRSVRIISPTPSGMDWNDVVREGAK